MASTFTWLDYSEHERRKMLDVIELFGEKTTRDELGLISHLAIPPRRGKNSSNWSRRIRGTRSSCSN